MHSNNKMRLSIKDVSHNKSETKTVDLRGLVCMQSSVYETIRILEAEMLQHALSVHFPCQLVGPLDPGCY